MAKTKNFPENQVGGFSWTLNVLDDLIEFCEFNQLTTSVNALKLAHLTMTPEIEAREFCKQVEVE